MNKHLISLLSCFLLSFSIVAQEQALNLEQALQQLAEHANAIKLFDKDIAASQEQLAVSKQFFLPKVGIEYTGVFTNSPLNAFGFKLNQEIVQQTDFAPDLLNNPEVISNFNTKIQVMQPIFNYDAQLQKNMRQQQVDALVYQQKHTINQLSLQLKNAYTQLQLLYATQAVLNESSKAMQAHEQIVGNFVKQGLGKLSDQLAIQVKLKSIDNQQVVIQQHIAKLSSFIAYLTGAPTATIYKPNQAIEAGNMAILPDSISKQRADLLAQQQGIAAQQTAVQMMKAQQLPRLNAFGEFNLNDASPTGFGATNFMVGFKLSWQLNLGKQLSAKVNSQQLAVEKAGIALADAKQQSQMQLQQLLAQEKAIQAQLENMKSSEELAKEQLRIMQNRFKEGLEKSADVLVAENQYSQVKLAIKQLYAQQHQTRNQLAFLLSSEQE